MAGGSPGCRPRRGDVLAVPGTPGRVHLLLLVLLLLLSSSPSSFVAGLDCSRGSDCSSGLCRNGQCCTRGDETCLTCSATSGACLSCAPGFLLRSSFFDGAVCRRADGGPCQTSADCASSVCKGGRCCGALGQAAGCSACGDDAEGRCAVCLSRRYVLEAGRCVGLVPAGEACARDDECAGGAACKGGVCCRDSGAAAPCSACALGTGLCASCVAPGHFLLGSECVPTLATGAVCAAHEQCLGRYCIGGRCCGTAGVPLACTACASSGACLGCAPAGSFFLSTAGTCLARRSVGSSCGINDQCVSGACKGGVCCSSQGVPAACLRCSTIAGSCSACQAGFFLSGGTCLALLAPGASCTADSQCAQLACKGGVCCAADGQNEACSSCRAGDGGCAVCWGRGSLGGLACQPRKVTGPCEADTECAHGACKRGACCAGSLALTAGCVACSREAGQCIECAASQLLLLGTCLPRVATGDSCLGSAQCPGGNPCRGHCCASRNASCTACDAVTGNCHSGGQDDAGSGSGSKSDRTRDATIASGVVACLLFVTLVALAGYLVRTKLPRQRPRRQSSEPNNDTNSNGSNGSDNNDAAVDGGDTEPLRAWDSPQRLPRGAPVPPAQQASPNRVFVDPDDDDLLPPYTLHEVPGRQCVVNVAFDFGPLGPPPPYPVSPALSLRRLENAAAVASQPPPPLQPPSPSTPMSPPVAAAAGPFLSLPPPRFPFESPRALLLAAEVADMADTAVGDAGDEGESMASRQQRAKRRRLPPVLASNFSSTEV